MSAPIELPMRVRESEDGTPAAASSACDRLLQSSATQIAAQIRRREISPVEVVRVHVEHAERVNARINAIAHERFGAALRDAREAEQRVMRGAPLGPLHGVPCTVKEGLGFAGLPKTAGSMLRRGCRASHDATVVARVRGAGGIVIGLTNQSEMALWPAADNLVYGRTENPWQTGRTAGGSSGGEAAIVATGGSVVGVGTDGGGSIRIPAAYCGVFGHKPSSRIAPLTGHVPLDDTFGHLPGAEAMARFFAPGPIARCAEDLMLMLRVIAGPDAVDRNICARTLIEPSIEQIKGRRVLVCDSPPVSRFRSVSGRASAAVRRAAMALESLGATLVPWTDPLLAQSFEIWASIVASGGALTMPAMIGQGRSPGLLRETVRRVAGRSQHTAAALLTCMAARWMTPGPAALSRYRRSAAMLRRRLNEAQGSGGLLLLPPVCTEAPGHYHAYLHPRDMGLTALFNAFELPATVAPVGLGDLGLPLSVQIVGPYGGDHLTLSAALGIEQILGGWQMPAM